MKYQQLSWTILTNSLLSGLLLFSASGCQTLDTNLATLLQAEPATEPARAAPADPNSPAFSVEFRSEGKKPVIVSVPLNDTMFVQQALDQVRATKKFRRFNLEIYRHLAKGGGHKIPIHYDRHKRRVDPATDYALHPQDRLVINEDTSTVLDDMMETLASGGFGL